MRIILTILSFIMITSEIYSQKVWMHSNKGQWNKEILYKIDLDLGEMYIENKGFTYFLHNFKKSHNHDGEKHSDDSLEANFQAQVIRTEFIGANWDGKRLEKAPSTFYRNYFLGTDSTKWKSNVLSYESIEFLNFYSGIDVIFDGTSNKLKYSFIVHPNGNSGNIKYTINGANSVFIDKEGQLHSTNRFGEIIESAPIAWTENEGRRTNVNVEYKLIDNQVSFYFPDGYDSTATLIIDPYLVFSTFTGSTADNWGFTATPDPSGNVFAGGIVFAGGYPVTVGAIDGDYNIGTESGFNIDVGITKFNSTGTSLLYSTYLGGNRNETPNSIISSLTGELYVLGVTSSGNFPMGPTSYDGSFNGGTTVTENSLTFSGTDIYIARLNSTGTSLLGSTYVGGGQNDGLNTSDLKFNYGDQFRGEIILDPTGNVYVASTTNSVDFPIVLGSQGAINGAQDAVVFKMNANLSTLLWSTYFGGSLNETGNSIQVASNGNVFVAGGTTSNNLPYSIGNDLSYNGGLADGYVTRYNGTTGAILSGTYMGLGEYDQAYFVQLDNLNEVYVYGQSQSAWTISPGVYGNANSGQFIRKYSNNLSTIQWTTMIGAGTGNVEISPTAFLVSDCFDIYLSGWGGLVNSQNSPAVNSSSNGFPVTDDAFQATTNGSNFYIAVLDQDAAFLKYATYMGGTSSSSNHVDGGTSRFDKSGRIYHAVCGACGGQDFGFTSTPGVWSPTNNSTNCNLAVFKFELNSIEAVVAAPDPLICIPAPVIFNNNSTNGNGFYWDFGDGTSSTLINPTHFYTVAGDYTVTLVVTDTNGCFSPDSLQFLIHIGDFEGGVVIPTFPVCPGETYQLEAYGGATYEWTPANVLDDPTSSTPFATVNETTLFTVIISDSCGSDTLQLTLPVYPVNSSISNDTSICVGNNVQITATGGGTYLWSPGSTLSSTVVSNPIATPTTNTVYSVIITSEDGCISNESTTVNVFYSPPIPIMPDSLQMCVGASIEITVSGGDNYIWSPNYQINQLTGPTVIVSPADDFTYICEFINACGATIDSVLIKVVEASIFAGNDTIICPGESAFLWASGGISYFWSPSSSLNNSTLSNVISTPNTPTLYSVIGVDEAGCVDTASVFVDLFPQPFIQTSPDVYAFYGDEIQLSATSTTAGPYVWSPAENLSCVICDNPIATPNFNTNYTVSYTDINGCIASDVIHIYYDPILYVPNTFTPDGNEFNNGFKIVANNIESFELLIFNRWGELLYTMNSFDDYWDGSYNGLKCQDGTYVWKLEYSDFKGVKYELTGHVNLIR